LKSSLVKTEEQNNQQLNEMQVLLKNNERDREENFQLKGQIEKIQLAMDKERVDYRESIALLKQQLDELRDKNLEKTVRETGLEEQIESLKNQIETEKRKHDSNDTLSKEVEFLQGLLAEEKAKSKSLNEERAALHHEMENIQETIQKERDEIMEKITRLEMVEHQQQKLQTVFEEQKLKRSGSDTDIHDIQNAYEEELGKARVTIRNLSNVIEQTEKTEKLQSLQLETLKTEIRDLERQQKRSEIDVEYLKNVMVKYIEIQDHEQMLPVISKILQFTPEEYKSLQVKLKSPKKERSILIGMYFCILYIKYVHLERFM